MAIVDGDGFIRREFLSKAMGLPSCVDVRSLTAMGDIFRITCRIELSGITACPTHLVYISCIQNRWVIEMDDGKAIDLDLWIKEMMDSLRCPQCFDLYPEGLGDRSIPSCESIICKMNDEEHRAMTMDVLQSNDVYL